MRKIVKRAWLIIGAVILLLVLVGLVIHQSRTQAISGSRAEALAYSVLKSISYSADRYRSISQTYG